MASRQSFITGAQRHRPQETALAVIPLYLELFGRPDVARRRIGERPAKMSPMEVADGLRISMKLFDNRRRVSVVKIDHEGQPAWLLTAMPEGKNAADDRAAMAARTAWLQGIGLG